MAELAEGVTRIYAEICRDGRCQSFRAQELATDILEDFFLDARHGELEVTAFTKEEMAHYIDLFENMRGAKLHNYIHRVRNFGRLWKTGDEKWDQVTFHEAHTVTRKMAFDFVCQCFQLAYDLPTNKVWNMTFALKAELSYTTPHVDNMFDWGALLTEVGETELDLSEDKELADGLRAVADNNSRFPLMVLDTNGANVWLYTIVSRQRLNQQPFFEAKQLKDMNHDEFADSIDLSANVGEYVCKRIAKKCISVHVCCSDGITRVYLTMGGYRFRLRKLSHIVRAFEKLTGQRPKEIEEDLDVDIPDDLFDFVVGKLRQTLAEEW